MKAGIRARPNRSPHSSAPIPLPSSGFPIRGHADAFPPGAARWSAAQNERPGPHVSPNPITEFHNSYRKSVSLFACVTGGGTGDFTDSGVSFGALAATNWQAPAFPSLDEDCPCSTCRRPPYPYLPESSAFWNSSQIEDRQRAH